MRIVIVGGGFGGIKTALELSKDSRCKITLIADKDHFLYYPALYGTATGHSHLESSVLLSDIFNDRENIKLVIDKVVSLNADRRIVVGSKKQYHYDNVILAMGVITSYFGIEGLSQYSYGIKSLEEVKELKSHLHDLLETDRHFDKNYVVVGAGPTGIELSAALVTYVKRIAKHHKVRQTKINVSLVEAAPRVLPRLSEKASNKVHKRLEKLGVHVKINSKVEKASAKNLIINGKPLASQTVIWTSGVANNPFFAENDHIFSLAPNGRVVVNEYLNAYPHVYVIGDNAATPYTGLAQTALHDAHFISQHLKRVLDKRPPRTYSSKKPPVVIPVGENWAICEWGRVTFGGFPASLLRRIADIIGYHDILPIGQALGAWRAQFETEETCPICVKAQLKRA